jgi:AsmA protein
MDYRIIHPDLYSEYRRYFAADEIRRKAPIKHADMKRPVKLISLVGCVLLVSIPTALLIIPFFLDVQKYKPHIERQVIEAIGRHLEVGDQLRLSLFPKTRFWFSDLHLANPSGFTEKDFIQAKVFEARFKLLPFILSRFKNIQMVRFFIKTPQIMLVKNADGRSNWEGFENPYDNISNIMSDSGKRLSMLAAAEVSPQVALAVNRFSISDGSFLWIDHQKKTRYSISHLDMDFANLGFDRPVRIDLSAKMDGRPVTLKGKIGPLGSLTGPGAVPVNLSVTALKQLKFKVEGHLNKPIDKPGFDFFLKLSEFSVPKLAVAVGRPIPITLSDKTGLNKVAFSVRAKGDFQSLEISEGVLDIDESKINLSVKVHNYSKPNISFGCSLDQIDLNRYRSARLSQKPGIRSKSKGIQTSKQRTSPFKRNYYNPLRQLALEGYLAVGKVKIKNTVIKNIKATVAAKNGVLHFAPISLQLSGGDLAASGSVNLRKKAPESHLRLYTKGIQLGPLLKDIWQKDYLEGTVNSKITLRMTGHNAIQIKKSLSGKGDIRIDNGAIIGIDLLTMIRNVAGSYDVSKSAENKPRTPFTRFLVPFSITRGIVYSHKAALASSQVRINATGKADIFKERLDIRLEPIKATSNKEKNKGSELWVPMRIFGSFSEPEFKPDLKSIVKENLSKKIIESSK